MSSRPRSFDSSIGFRRYEIVNTTAFPFVTHGRLFVEDEGWAWSCSATIVSAANERTVATAGHCIYDVEGLGFPDAVYFAPGYRLGRAPFGYWPAVHAWVPGQWSRGVDAGAPDDRYDLGFVNVAPSPAGTTLSDAFGARGIAFNLGRTSFSSFGYPADFPFDGERLITCESASGGVDAYQLVPQPNAMGCDMTGGSSGGGWVASGTSWVNSVVSYHYEDEPGVQYGPYFGEVAQAVYAEAATFGGVPPGPTSPPTVAPTPPLTSTPAPTTTPTAPPTATPTPTAVPTASPAPSPPPDTLAPYVDAVSDRPDPFSPDGDGVKDKTKISWSLTESVPYASVDVYRGYALVKSFGERSLEAGGWFVKWAGRNNAGQKVKDGTYSYVIHVQDLAGNVREVEGRTTLDR